MKDALPIVAIVTDEIDGDTEAFAGRDVTIRRIAWSDDSRPLLPADLVQRVHGSGAVTACFGPDVPVELALAVASQLEIAVPVTGSLLVREPTSDLWRESARAGIRDIVSPVNVPTELEPALKAEAERITLVRAARHEDVPGSDHQGRIIVTLSPKGGSGKTMVSTNMSVALAQAMSTDVVLVDLDCVFGDCASVLGLVPENNIGQLALLSEIDGTSVKMFLTRHEPSGMFVLAGASTPEEGEAVTPEVAQKIISTLARDVGHVIIDTAAGLDELALAAIELASDLVFVASLDVTSIRNLGKEVDALDRHGLTASRRHFVINRADARVGLALEDVEAAIGLELDAALPSSRSVPLSMNQGTVIVLSEPESALARTLTAFARQFMSGDANEQTDDRRGRLFKRR